MNTKIQGTYVPFTCTNLTQTLSRSESNLTLDLADMELTTSTNYSRVYTLTMTISALSQSASILISSSQLNGIPLTRVGNVYTISSEYVNAQGVKMNNWAYFSIALRSFSVNFSNSDVGETFTITNSITDGATTLTGTTTIYTAAVPDVTGNIQTLTVPMAMNGKTLVGLGGANLAINDANQASKTYRVTYTVNNTTNGTGTSQMKLGIQQGAENTGWQTSYSLSGTQAYINSQIAGSGANYNGLYFVNYAPDFRGQTSVSYVQEVLTTTEVGAIVPYVQETGTLTFNTAYTAPYAIGSNPTYTEDGSVTFSLGSITDLAGTNYAHETCGVYQGYNCYTVTATVLGSFSGANPVVLTYAGDAGVDNSVTFTGSKSSVNAQLTSVQLIPPADYTDPLTIQVVVTRGNTPVTLYTGNITATCTSTHADFTTTGSQPFVLGSNIWNVGSITDLAAGKSYSATLDFASAIDATLSSSGSGGTSTWNSTGGTGGFGGLTLTGTKTQVNSHLAAINFTTSGATTLDSFVSILYSQTQTTNTVSQGTSSIAVGNTINWKAGNGVHGSSAAFVYDQDVAMTWDLASLGGQVNGSTTYTVKLIFSTPLNVTNLGSVTGWTRETDYIWTKTGLKAALNSALSAVVFNPPAQLVSDFTLDISVYDGATLVGSTSALGSTETVYIRDLVSVTWTASALTYDQDNTAIWANLATLNSNFSAGTYTLRLKTSVATGGSISGWTNIDSTTFEKTDTKANLQTALNSLTFTPSISFVSNFTFNLEAYRSNKLLYTSATLSNSKSISIGVRYYLDTSGPDFVLNQEEVNIWTNVATLSSNFKDDITYTIIVDCWAIKIDGWDWPWNFIKTDTGANLRIALASWSVIARPDSGFASGELYFEIRKDNITVYDSNNEPRPWRRFVAGPRQYEISTPTPWYGYFDQDTPRMYTNLFVLNEVYVDDEIYTANLYTNAYDYDQNDHAVIESITGWSADKSTSGHYSFSKTDTGANLKIAVDNLYITPTLLNTEAFEIQLVVAKGGWAKYPDTEFWTTPPKIRVVQPDNHYWLTLNDMVSTDTTMTHSYQYNTATVISSLGVFAPDGHDDAPYTITVTMSGYYNPYESSIPLGSGTITGVGWTSVSPSVLTATGTKATIDSLLSNGFTFNPTTNTVGRVRVDFVIEKLGVNLLNSHRIYAEFLKIGCANPPTVTQPLPPLLPVVFVPGQSATQTPIVSLSNIPDDATSYTLVLSSTVAGSDITLNGSSAVWTRTSNSYQAHDFTTPLLDKTALLSAVSSVNITLPSTSKQEQTLIATLKHSTGMILSTYNFNIYNGFAIYNSANNASRYIAQGVYDIYHCNATLNVVKNIYVGTTTNQYYNRYDQSLTYKLVIDTTHPDFIIHGWVNTPGNIYTLTGTISTISAALESLPVLFKQHLHSVYTTFTIYKDIGNEVLWTCRPQFWSRF